ncbi:pyridoxal-phosphate dependent enzyme [Hoeflea sp. 108]|jgi:threonine synthase|uniref:pyridoxal-phosphate dependent enzyme n=1 Tax=Hoeflea sp. 108 TaxID=1116369 RepID=UPI00047546AA|nr:pyridoxal-phosphate dependent enzyme [Hoeflea sp. 108]
MAQKNDRWSLLERVADRPGWFVASPYRHPVVGSHPIGIEGYKTIAYEIAEQLYGDVPDWCVLPVCYGDALAGVAAGFRDLLSRGKIGRIPRLVAAEVHGSLRPDRGTAAVLRNDSTVDWHDTQHIPGCEGIA